MIAFGMDDTYFTMYYLDIWNDAEMRYVTVLSNESYDAIEDAFEDMHDDEGNLIKSHLTSCIRIRSQDVAVTNRVIRKSGGYDLRKVEALTA